MSGIAGIHSRSGAPIDEALLERMQRLVPHRAAAAVHRYRASHIALDQYAGDGGYGAARLVVVAHARIDDEDALRSALGDAAPAAEAGESALIAAAYQCWGVEGLGRLLGDFAIVLWDERERRLVLARDAMSMRPLYYRADAERVLFASEVKQLLAVPGVPKDIDERMAASYLMGAFGDPSWSYFRAIAQVPPGHAVIVQPESVRTTKLWDIDATREIRYRRQDEYAEDFRERFLASTRDRIRRRARVGIFLSGGLDSGAVASAAGWLGEQEGSNRALFSYSWDFGEFRKADERHRSRLIVERYGIASRDVPAWDAGPLATYPADEPDLDDPFHGHFQSLIDRGFRAAQADGVESLFTGMRGDLVVGPTDEKYATLISSRRWSALRKELAEHRSVTGYPWHRLIRRLVFPPLRAHWREALGFGAGADRNAPGAAPEWLRKEFVDRVGLLDLVKEYGRVTPPGLGSAFREDRYRWVFSPMLMRWATSHERRASQFGLKAEDSWSDRRLLEFSVAIPQQVLDPALEYNKRFVRESLGQIVPREFLRTAGKTLPTPLFQSAMRMAASHGALTLMTERVASVELGWIDSAVIRDVLRGLAAGGPVPPMLWWTLSLEWWLKTLAHGTKPAQEDDV